MMSVCRILFWLPFTLLAVVLSGCGGGGGGGGSSSLAIGTFTRSFAPTATGDNVMPFGSGSFGDVRHQTVYTAAEVGSAGRISALRFRFFSALGVAVSCPNTTVRLGHTSLSSLTATFANNVDRGSFHTALDNATVNIPAGGAGSWFTVTLNTPFEYNGQDNLVVEIERTTTCSADVHIATVNDAGNRRAESEAADTVAGTAQHNNVTAGTVDVVHPLLQFVFSGGDNFVSYGGSTSNSVPFIISAIPEARHSQFLYLANEINGSGPITGIAFVVNTATTVAANYTVNVKLGHTSLSTLGTGIAANFNSGTPAMVASNLNFTVPAGVPAGRPVWIPLTGSFNYNGTDNLIVDIEVSGSGGSTFMRTLGGMPGRRLYSLVGAVTGTVDSLGGYDTYFRFHGATVTVMPLQNGGSSQSFGRPAGGQIQNLYRPTYLGTGGKITSVALRLSPYDPVNAATVPNFRIRMGHTSKTTLTPSDSYTSNMDENRQVYSGTLSVPAGASPGDWITVPLQNSFTYDPSRNLVVLFSADDSGVDNTALAHTDATEFASHAVGDNNNNNDAPGWGYNGAMSVRFGISK